MRQMVQSLLTNAVDKMATEIQEDDKLELTTLSRNCILHALQVLSKQGNVHTVSGLDKIKEFCSECLEAVSGRASNKRKPSVQLTVSEELIVEPNVISQFYEGKLTAKKFFLQIEKKIYEVWKEDFDQDILYRVCWKVYCTEKRPRDNLSKWFTDDCMYRLWLVFNAVLPPKSDGTFKASVKSLNEIWKRMLELCGHEHPNCEYNSIKVALEYLEYLQATANYIERFELNPSLVYEVSCMYKVCKVSIQGLAWQLDNLSFDLYLSQNIPMYLHDC